MYKAKNQLVYGFQRQRIDESLRNRMDSQSSGSFEYLRYMASEARREQLEAMLDFNANVIEMEKNRAKKNDIDKGQATLYRINYGVMNHGFRRNLLEDTSTEELISEEGLEEIVVGVEDVSPVEKEVVEESQTIDTSNASRFRKLSKKIVDNPAAVAGVVVIGKKGHNKKQKVITNPQSGFYVPTKKARPAVYLPGHHKVYFKPTWAPPKEVVYSQPKPKKKVNYPAPKDGGYTYYKESGSPNGQMYYQPIKTVPMTGKEKEEEKEKVGSFIEENDVLNEIEEDEKDNTNDKINETKMITSDNYNEIPAEAATTNEIKIEENIVDAKPSNRGGLRK